MKNINNSYNCEIMYHNWLDNKSTISNSPDIFYFKIYEKFHITMDQILTNVLYDIRINPDIISLSSLLMFLPIYFIDSIKIKGLCFLIHDILDRCDGVMARLYIKNNIERNKDFGAYLDAILDKIFVILIGTFVINNNLVKCKMILHLFSGFKRTLIYFENKKSKKNKSTFSGKMGTFLENISFFSSKFS